MWTNSTRVKSTTHKLARRAIEKKEKATSTELYKKVCHPATTEVKPKQEEAIVEQAPASETPTPARAWIRPHQVFDHHNFPKTKKTILSVSVEILSIKPLGNHPCQMRTLFLFNHAMFLRPHLNDIFQNMVN